MVSRREFLAAAVAAPNATKLAESTALARPAPLATDNSDSPATFFQPTALPPGTVYVGGEIGRRINITVNNNLLALDGEKDFLNPLRERNRTDGYVGLGQLIDAAVRFSICTRDARVLAFKQRLVAEVLKTQEGDGYIGYFQPGRRVWALWDFQEIFNIFYGLAMDHHFYGETTSLEGATKLADYLIARWKAVPEKVFGKNEISMQLPLGGFDHALLTLHEETHDAKYLAFLREVRQVAGWDNRIILGRWGKLEGHSFTYLAQSTAMMRLNRLEPDPVLLQPASALLDFLRNRDGMAITGACGDMECWHDSQEGTMNLGETCATVCATYWLDELMRGEGKALYGDMMERVIFNTLFGAQSPDGRNLRYFTALDGRRQYYDKDTYCCPNNFRRGIATLPDQIYYRIGNGLAINLYTESSAEVKLGSGITVNLRQETDYPKGGQVVIHVEPSRAAHFPLSLRIPAWCRSPRVSVNGQASEAAATPGRFLVLQHEWNPGDQVQLDLPMAPRWVKGRQSQSGRVALMQGPQVFCLNRSRHPELKETDLRLLVIDPQTLQGPFTDKSVRPNGLAFRVKARMPEDWYRLEQFTYTLTLTEFPDPGGEATYLKVVNPGDDRFVHDELLAGPQLS